MLDTGDPILAEGPTYPGAVPSFSACGAEVHQVPMDADGIRLDRLAEAHERLLAEGRPPKFLYVIPTFQNPAGATLSLERRHALVAYAQERDLLLVEDDPYGQLRFEGEPLPTLHSLDATGRVIYLGTLSKIFSPGVRVGWIHAPHPILYRVNLVKQANDLCTSTVRAAAGAGLPAPRAARRGRAAADPRLPPRGATPWSRRMHEFLPDATFTTPAGGLFLWATLADGLDTTDLLAAALDRNVAFVPGVAAYVDGVTGSSSMRLNFSACDEERIAEGVRRIGDVARERAALARALGPRAAAPTQ